MKKKRNNSRITLQTYFNLFALLMLLGHSACVNPSKENKKADIPKVLDQVSITNNYFTVDGDSVQFKGLCLEDIGQLIELGNWNEEYLYQASTWNINIVRFPIHPIHLNNLGVENYIKELRQGIYWAKKYNMYSIIDWHIIGNMKDEKWQAPIYETTMEQTLDFWKIIASEFKNEPAVAFYELYNEPTVYGGKLGTMNWNELMDIYAEIIQTVRTYDTTTITLLGGLDWSYDLTGLNDYDLNFKNSGFTAHPYPQKSPEPWVGNWDKYFGFVTEKYPVFATEFGYAYEDQKGAHIPVIGDEKYGRAVLDYFNKRNISYTAWCFSWDWYPTLLKDSTYTPQEGQGEFFKNEFLKNKF